MDRLEEYSPVVEISTDRGEERGRRAQDIERR